MSGFKTDPSTVKVVVVGAGVCRLTAAHELARRGFNVEVFDSAHHKGGLAWSKKAKPPSTPPIGNEELGHPTGSGATALPVEHGFRFFPGFYRHLYDTMSRTPMPGKPHCCSPACTVLLPGGSACPCCATTIPGPITGTALCPICTGWIPSDLEETAADRLVAVTTQGVALEDGREFFTYGRQKNTDITESLDELATAADYLGATAQDIARLLLKVVEYLTTSPERRADLEDISWWDFLEGAEFTPGFAQYIDRVPRALVGMSAKESDARTQGTVTAQLMLDQLGDGINVDRILDGDTQERWLDPWAEYLEKKLGVTFRPQMELQSFNTPGPVPIVDRSTPLKVFSAEFQKVKRWGGSTSASAQRRWRRTSSCSPSRWTWRTRSSAGSRARTRRSRAPGHRTPPLPTPTCSRAPGQWTTPSNGWRPFRAGCSLSTQIRTTCGCSACSSSCGTTCRSSRATCTTRTPPGGSPQSASPSSGLTTSSRPGATTWWAAPSPSTSATGEPPLRRPRRRESLERWRMRSPSSSSSTRSGGSCTRRWTAGGTTRWGRG